MNSILKSYKSTLILLGALAAGACVGLFLPSVAHVIKPIGQIFLNFMFVLVVPMVFFSITVSFQRMKESGMLGRVFLTLILVFLGMSMIAGIVSYIACLIYNPIGDIDRSLITGGLLDTSAQATSISDAIVGSVSVPDFPMLFSKSALLPLIIFGMLFGFAISAVGEKAKPMIDLVEAGNTVTMKMMDYAMKAAPIGLGCFFADTVSQIGSQLLGGYLRTMILYVGLTVIFFFLINPAYVLLARGVKGLKAYWLNVLPPSLTAMATCSSALAMPGNIEAAKAIGVRPEIAESVIPFGTNIHKDGSVMSGVVKTAFLMILFGQSISTVPGGITVLLVGVLSSIVLGAVTGGGMVGELLICTMLGFPPETAGIIIVVGTIIDMPATLMNSSSNVVGSILVDKFCARQN